jgi:hypothetical protein
VVESQAFQERKIAFVGMDDTESASLDIPQVEGNRGQSAEEGRVHEFAILEIQNEGRTALGDHGPGEIFDVRTVLEIPPALHFDPDRGPDAPDAASSGAKPPSEVEAGVTTTIATVPPNGEVITIQSLANVSTGALGGTFTRVEGSVAASSITSFATAIAAGDLTIEGDDAALRTIVDHLDVFLGGFPIVEP